MERKKFILFDNAPVNTSYSSFKSGTFGASMKEQYSSFVRIGNEALQHGEDSAAAIDFSSVTQGFGFYSEGGPIGDNLVQNSDFNPSGTSAWTLSVGSNADAVPTFGVDDYNHQFETTSDALFGGGRLKMRTYEGSGNIAPYVSQDIVLGENLGLVSKIGWTKWEIHSGNNAGAEFVRNPTGLSIYGSYPIYPQLRVTYNGNSTDYYHIANNQPFRIDTPQTEANIHVYGFVPAADIAALGASPGDTVSIELHAKGVPSNGITTGHNYELVFDSFEVYESAGASLGFYSINPYECTDYFNFFEGVSAEEGIEDLIKVLEASSSLGENGNKESLVSVEDLDLNARKVYGCAAWIN